MVFKKDGNSIHAFLRSSITLYIAICRNGTKHPSDLLSVIHFRVSLDLFERLLVLLLISILLISIFISTAIFSLYIFYPLCDLRPSFCDLYTMMPQL